MQEKIIGLPLLNLEKNVNKGIINSPGYRDVKMPCKDVMHQPPQHLYIPPGKIYVHVCPTCGYTVTIKSPDIYF